MNTGPAGKLYTPELLALATELAHFRLTDDLPLRGEGRSRTCGSTASLGLRLTGTGTIDAVGMKISACAIGQASAAIMARGLAGKTSLELSAVQQQIARWLEHGGPLPEWPGFEAIEPAGAYSGRHGAIMLPWNAALDALSKANVTG